MSIERDCADILKENYLPYAVGTIRGRAIPGIDGLKPVHRKILYVMYTMGLLNKKTKSANIVGQTMQYHPHGDMAIYEAMVRMADGNESLLLPYIESKGNFGKVFSRDMSFAASRYTEAGLADIAKEMFEGINENAVDFVDNYDSTRKEPTLLPVKFPSILVNTAPGIAVGMGSNIPSYNLKEVCDATIAIINGLTGAKNISKILKAPDFPNGGIVHRDGKDLVNILNGRGSVSISAKMSIKGNRATITEIPYTTTIEAIIEKVANLQKVGRLNEISDIKDASDLQGLRINVDFKRGTDVEYAMKNLFRVTGLRSKASFTNRVIINNEPEFLTVEEMLNEWLSFRLDTLTRVYNHRLEKDIASEELLITWELIRHNLKDVINTISDMNEKQAKESLVEKYKLNQKQADVLLDSRIRNITTDNANKKLDKLAEVRKDIKLNTEYKDNKDKKSGQIISELEYISKKYGKQRFSSIGGEVKVFKPKDEVIDDSGVIVLTTERGFIKKFKTEVSEATFTESIKGTDKVANRFECKNNDDVLIFTHSGKCFKIPVIDIDETRGTAKDMIVKYVPEDEIELYTTISDGYDRVINFINASGKGDAVHLSRVSGNRSVYISIYPEAEKGDIKVIEEDKFFIVTNKRRAVFVNLDFMDNKGKKYSGRIRGCRIPAGEKLFGVLPWSKVPDKDEVDVEPYMKGYLVNIKHKLW